MVADNPNLKIPSVSAFEKPYAPPMTNATPPSCGSYSPDPPDYTTSIQQGQEQQVRDTDEAWDERRLGADEEFAAVAEEQDVDLSKVEWVDHPKHYNAHPSGVEAIIMCEVMEFNPGNAFKYVYRCFEKAKSLGDNDKVVQDLKKALWYVDREYLRLERLSNLPIYILRKFQSNVLFTEEHEALASNIVDCEQRRSAKMVFTLLFDRVSVKERRGHMITCGHYIEAMIKEVQTEGEV